MTFDGSTIRAQRRAAAVQLRASGWSLRAIAERLGVGRSTVLDDLREADVTAPTTTTAETTAAPARYPLDGETGRLLVALQALDGAGLTDALSGAREHLARADALIASDRDGHGRANAVRDRLAEAVADGTVSLETAGAELAALAGWLPTATGDTSPAGRVADAAVREIRRRAVQSAREDALGVHQALAQRAEVAVRAAVEAGGALVDLKAVTRALRPPQPVRTGRVTVHPWVDNPPTLPTVDVDAIMRDPRRATAWANATSAAEQVRGLLAVAGAVCTFSGGSARLYPDGVLDDNVCHFVEQMPAAVHLAVTDALGWRPGLYWSLRPAASRPDGAEIRGGIRMPVPWTEPRQPARYGPLIANG